ncbi:MAG: FkbM family methyltransferase [Candidatus Binatia bacterium]
MTGDVRAEVVWRLPGLLERLHRPDFFFVNIGANDGVSNDPIHPFLRRYGWRGIAVEPVGYICDELRRNYADLPGVIVEHAAVTSTPRPLCFVPPEATRHGFVRQVGSLHPDYLEKTIALMRLYEFAGPVEADLERHIQRVEVPCFTFEELLTRHRVRHIDFLNIDAEQCDFEILSMIDFTRWRPSVLCIETSEFTEEQDLRARQLLHLAGYAYLEPFDIFSEVFVRNDHVGRC